MVDIFNNNVGFNCINVVASEDISTNGYDLVFNESIRICKFQGIQDGHVLCNRTSSLNDNMDRLCNCKNKGM